MIQDNEIITLILGTGVLAFALVYLRRLDEAVKPRILMISYIFALCGWIFTIIEGFKYPDLLPDITYAGLLNIVEHLCYALSAIWLAWWSSCVYSTKRTAEQ